MWVSTFTRCACEDPRRDCAASVSQVVYGLSFEQRQLSAMKRSMQKLNIDTGWSSATISNAKIISNAEDICEKHLDYVAKFMRNVIKNIQQKYKNHDDELR